MMYLQVWLILSITVFSGLNEFIRAVPHEISNSIVQQDRDEVETTCGIGQNHSLNASAICMPNSKDALPTYWAFYKDTRDASSHSSTLNISIQDEFGEVSERRYCNTLKLTKSYPSTLELTLWKQYELIFNARLNTTFGTSSALLHAHYHAVNQRSDEMLKFVCTKYLQASDHADLQRNHKLESNDGLLTFYTSSKTHNATCFKVFKAPVMPFQTIAELPHPSALKLHLIVYEIIESNPHTLQMSDMLLQFSFNCKYFIPQGTIYNHFCEDIEAGHSHLSQLLQADSLNSTEHIHNFYWTAKETKLFYESGPWSTDSNRAYLWNKLHTHHLQGQNIWNICNYSYLPQHISFQEELLVLDLDLFTSVGTNRAQGCLAHLVAVFANQTSVHYISIANSPQLQNFWKEKLDFPQ